MGCAPSAIADGEEEEGVRNGEGEDGPTRKQSNEMIRSTSSENPSASVTSPASRNGSAKHVPLLNNALDQRNSLGSEGAPSGRRSAGSRKGSGSSNRSGRMNHRLSSDNGVPIPGSVVRSDYRNNLNQQPLTDIEQEMSATNGMGKPVSSKELSINSLVSSPSRNPSTMNNSGEQQSSVQNGKQPARGDTPAVPYYNGRNESLYGNSKTSSEPKAENFNQDRNFDRINTVNENDEERSGIGNAALGNSNKENSQNKDDNFLSTRGYGETTGKSEPRNEEKDVQSEYPSTSNVVNGFDSGRTDMDKGLQRDSLDEDPKGANASGYNSFVSSSGSTVGQAGSLYQTTDNNPFTKNDAGIEPQANKTHGFSTNSTRDGKNDDSGLTRPDEFHTALPDVKNSPRVGSSTENHTFGSNYASREQANSTGDFSKPSYEADEMPKSRDHYGGIPGLENRANGTRMSPTHVMSRSNGNADGSDIWAAPDSPSVAQHQHNSYFGSAAIADHTAPSDTDTDPAKLGEPLEISYTCFMNEPVHKRNETKFPIESQNYVEATGSSVNGSRPTGQEEKAYARKAPSSKTSLSSNRPMSSAAVSISDLLSDSDEMDASLSTSAAAMLAFPNRSSTARYRRSHALDRGHTDHNSPDGGKSPVEQMRENVPGSDFGMKVESDEPDKTREGTFGLSHEMEEGSHTRDVGFNEEKTDGIEGIRAGNEAITTDAEEISVASDVVTTEVEALSDPNEVDKTAIENINVANEWNIAEAGDVTTGSEEITTNAEEITAGNEVTTTNIEEIAIGNAATTSNGEGMTPRNVLKTMNIEELTAGNEAKAADIEEITTGNEVITTHIEEIAPGDEASTAGIEEIVASSEMITENNDSKAARNGVTTTNVEEIATGTEMVTGNQASVAGGSQVMAGPNPGSSVANEGQNSQAPEQIDAPFAVQGGERHEFSRQMSADSGFCHQIFPPAESFGMQGSEMDDGAGPSGEHIPILPDAVPSNAMCPSSTFDEENEAIEIAASKGIENDIYERTAATDPPAAEKHFSDMMATDQVVFRGLPSMQAVNEHIVNQNDVNDSSDFKMSNGIATHSFFSPNSSQNMSYNLGQSFVGSEAGAHQSLEEDTTDPALYLTHDDSLPSSLEAHFPCSKIDLVSETSDSFSGEEGLVPHEDLRTDVDFDVCHETILEQYTDEESEAASSKWLFKLNLDSNTEPSVKESSSDATPRDLNNRSTSEILGLEQQLIKDGALNKAKDEVVARDSVLTGASLFGHSTNANTEQDASAPNANPTAFFSESTSDETLRQSDTETVREEVSHQSSVQDSNQNKEVIGLDRPGSSVNLSLADKTTVESPAALAVQNANIEIGENTAHNIPSETNNVDLSDEKKNETLDMTSSKNEPYETPNVDEQSQERSLTTEINREGNIAAENLAAEKTLTLSAPRLPTEVHGDDNPTHKENTTMETDFFESAGIMESTNSNEATSLSERPQTTASQALEKVEEVKSAGLVGALKYAEAQDIAEEEEYTKNIEFDSMLFGTRKVRLDDQIKQNSFDTLSLKRDSDEEPMSTAELTDANNLNKIDQLAIAEELYEVVESAEALETQSVTGFITVKEVIKPQDALRVENSDDIQESAHTSSPSADGLIAPSLGHPTENEPEEITSKEETSPKPESPYAKDACGEREPAEMTKSNDETSLKTKSLDTNDTFVENPQSTENPHSPMSTAIDNESEQTNSDNGGDLYPICNVNEDFGNNIQETSAPDTLLLHNNPLDSCFEASAATDASEYSNENSYVNENDFQRGTNGSLLADYIEDSVDHLDSAAADPNVISDDIAEQSFQSEISSPILAAGEDLIRYAATESDRVSIKNQINSLIAQEYKSRSNSPVTVRSSSRSNSPTIYFQNSTFNSSVSQLPNSQVNLPPKRILKTLSNSSVTRFPNSRSSSPAISYVSNASASRLRNSRSRHSSPTLLLAKTDSVMHAPLGSVS